MAHWPVILLFLIIAFVYSSVGFGGGSSYLAILTLFSFPFQEMKLIALVCNILVVTGGTIIFIRSKQVDWKKVLPLALASVPMAFLGATLKLSEDTFFVVLGCCLVVAAILLWIQTNMATTVDPQIKNSHIQKDAVIGGAIGFLSGMVGIGGGIFLSPLLNLMRWDTPKKIAATASFFILVNSISGLAGQFRVLPENIDFTTVMLLCIAVLAGGQAGARLGAIRFNPLTIRRVTSVVVLVAGIEVLHKHAHLW